MSVDWVEEERKICKNLHPKVDGDSDNVITW